LAEQTKSRPRHSNDNGLVESKNGAVIRKRIGYGYIASPHAEAVGVLPRAFQSLSELSSTVWRAGNDDGQKREAAPDLSPLRDALGNVATAPGLMTHLKPGITAESLQRTADARSDTNAARSMQEAKRKLFADLLQRRTA
jgi:hypothetical protein